MPLKENEILNQRYQIQQVLSDKGAMGVIYLALDRKFSETKVVIKQLRFTDAESMRRDEQYCKYGNEQLREIVTDARQAFEREAELLFLLKHRALPRVFDRFQTAAGEECLAMDFIVGRDFDELLAAHRGPFPLTQVLDWAEQILDVLDYLHTQFAEPIIHRDLNPRNLKLTPEGRVVLLDFGLAKGSLPDMTRVVGSILLSDANDYAPLEQVDDDEHERRKSDPRSDLYSLAVTLYHLLSGRKPARALSRVAAKARGGADPLRPLNEVAPHVPATVAAVLQQAAAVFAEDRPASAAELRRLLRQAVKPAAPNIIVPPPEPEQPTVVRPQPAPPETRRRIVVSVDPAAQKPTPSAPEPAPPAPPPAPPISTPDRIVLSKAAQPRSYSEDLGNGVRLEMIAVPRGSFLMGSPDGVGFNDERPQHRVTLAPFWIGKYPVTQAQWQAVMGDNPSRFKGDDLPVERVSWADAVKFYEAISQRTGKKYRLPSEAEWEYACRAGSSGGYCFGDDESLLEQYAWYGNNSGQRRIDAAKLWKEDSNKYWDKLSENGNQTHPVGEKKPNAWGLYDMHGNVWEWCEDVWHDSYGGQHSNLPIDGSAWLSGRDSSLRVLRGGSWGNLDWFCRSAVRGRDAPGDRLNVIGFRVVVSARTL